MFEFPIKYSEPVYRPPSEGRSLLIPVTKGCSHNKCTYCNMYRSKKYAELEIDEITDNIRKAASYFEARGASPRRAFLLDGDALGAPQSLLVSTLKCIQDELPQITRVGSYATAANMLEKSEEELSELCALDLSIVYLGMESGSDKVLKRIVKGNTADDMVQGSLKVKRAGMKLSNIAMLGIGGREFSEEHVKETARVISETAPNYFSFLTTTAIPDTPYFTMVERGQASPLTIKELLTEMRDILSSLSLGDKKIIFRANHVSNQYPLGGTLPKDTQTIISTLNTWIEECPEGSYPSTNPEYM